MLRKKTLSEKILVLIDMFFEDMFWILYILFIVLAPVVALGIFVTGLYTTFFA